MYYWITLVAYIATLAEEVASKILSQIMLRPTPPKGDERDAG
jgi:hypothetical protein